MEDVENMITEGGSRHRKFVLPDAREVAAQRKLAREKQQERLRELTKQFPQLCEDATISLEAGPNGEASSPTENTDEISDIKKALNSFEQSFKLSIEIDNPGIDISQIDALEISKDLKKVRAHFIKCVIKYIARADETNLKNILDALLGDIDEHLSNKEIMLEYEDFLCFYIILCLISLDKRCRLVNTNIIGIDKFQCLFNKMPHALKNRDTVKKFSNIVLEKFNHFHDQFFIAERLCMLTCNLGNMDFHPLNFSTMISKQILCGILCQLLKCDSDDNFTVNSFSQLKKIIRKGLKSSSPDPYKQFIIIKIITMWTNLVSINKNEKEAKAIKWLRTFEFNNNHLDRMNVNVHVVQDLKSFTNVKWQILNREMCTD